MIDRPTTPAPTNEDERHDDFEYNPALEPGKSLAWLNLLRESEKAFKDWNDRCDKVDKLYANLADLANMNRDKQFQMFWANCEVLKPSIYAKPPQPVVAPKFKDRRPVYQAASEMLERCCTVAFDLTRIDDLMLLVRDDVAMVGRGVAWLRYETKKESGQGFEKVCIDYKDRRDFLHSLSRNWREVTWVAAASYLTRAQARERFHSASGDEYQDAEYKVDKDANEIGGGDRRERAKFWEIWDKDSNRVVWVAEGCELILDESDPHLALQDFFPCPKPAYGTVQRGSLVPVPDVLQYKDQLDEVNLLTGRIHALSDAIEAKGFYPAGGAEIGDAVQAAIQTNTPGRVLVPISNWAAFGGSKEVIIWLPIDVIAQTVTALVTLRQQIIQDIYQIMGLSDIMRGATDPGETLGAQQLKTQYGSTRIRDKQQEMVRIAKDMVEITAEIIIDKFSNRTIVEMSQTQLPTNDMIEQQAQQIQQAVAQGQDILAQGQQQAPEAMQQLQQQMQQAQMALQKLAEQPTLDQVLNFLGDATARAFVLDIETDSTIQADENTEKQRRAEFVGVLAQMLPQLSNMIAADPATADFCGEILKFATAPYRAGRSLDGAIDNLVLQMKEKAGQPQPEDPATAAARTTKEVETMKVEQKRESDNNRLQLDREEMQLKDANEKQRIQFDKDVKIYEINKQGQQDQSKARLANQEMINSREEHQQKMIEGQQKIVQNQQKGQLAQQQATMRQNDMIARANERRQNQQFKQQQSLMRPPGARPS